MANTRVVHRLEGLRATYGVSSEVVASACFSMCAAAVVLLLAALGPAMADPHRTGEVVPARAVGFVLLGLAWLAVATIEWARGHRRTGAELLGVAGVIALSTLITVPVPAPYTLGIVVAPLVGAPLGTYVILRYPEVALRRWADRAPIVLAAVGGASAIPVHLLYTPHLYGCPTCTPDLNLLYVRSDDGLLAIVMAVGGVAVIGSLVALTAVILRRYRTAGPVARRVVGPVTISVLVYVAGTVLYVLDQNVMLSQLLPMQATRGLGGAAFLVAGTAAPIGLLVGRARERSLLGGLSDLMAPMEASSLEMALQRLVGDPHLQVGRAAPDGTHVAADGTPLALPAAGDTGGLTVTSLGDGVGVLVHEAALLRQRSLLDALTVVASLAVRNQQLTEEVLARLDEVRASRARLVRASDEARRRIERDLHDGAQQRLLTTALRVRMLLVQVRDEAAGQDRDALACGLEQVSDELQVGLQELRELASGMFPTALAMGLPPALDELVARTGVPVTVDAQLARRLPEGVEAGAYFMIAECLTNVIKHASVPARIVVRDGGDHLSVQIEDDGPGGADPSGAGLSGLRDRVAALGGNLGVHSAPGQGTAVSATFPVAPVLAG